MRIRNSHENTFLNVPKSNEPTQFFKGLSGLLSLSLSLSSRTPSVETHQTHAHTPIEHLFLNKNMFVDTERSQCNILSFPSLPFFLFLSLSLFFPNFFSLPLFLSRTVMFTLRIKTKTNEIQKQ